MLLKKIKYVLFSFVFIMSNSIVLADDADIYFSSDSIVSPNILFLLDSSGSMQLAVPGDPKSRDRMEVMQDSLDQVLDGASPFLNVGIMNFSGHNKKEFVNGPSFPVSPIDDPALPIVSSNLVPAVLKKSGHEYEGMFDISQDNIPDPADATVSVRDFLKQVGKNWKHEKYTPIADALYEAARYYRGDEPDWGNQVGSDQRAAHPSTYEGHIFNERSVTATNKCTTGNICRGSACGSKTTTGCTMVTTKVSCDTATGTLPLASCGTSCVFDKSVARDCKLSDSCGSSCTNFTKTIKFNSSTSKPGCTKKTTNKKVKFCVAGKFDPESGKCLKFAEKTVTSTHYECSRTETWKKCFKDRYQCNRDIQECTYDECKINTTFGSWNRKNSPVVKYKSPIEQSCQKSFIVLLSDGGPDIRDRSSALTTSAQGQIKSLAGVPSCQPVKSLFAADDELKTFSTTTQTVGTTLDHGLCAPELSEALATTDQIDNSLIPDDQTVATYTIGFGLAAKSAEEGYLKLLAKKGEGEYFGATDSDSLVKAFNDILTEIGSTSSSYASPAYSVNQSTQFSHKDDVFLPVFSVSNFPRWSGNLKKFKMQDGALQGLAKPGDLSTLSPAVDEQGVVAPDISDIWSNTEKDGSNVKKGGVANLLDPATRKLYSNLAGDTNINLADAVNHIKSGNINAGDLGLSTSDASYVDKLITFIRGFEDDGVSSRNHMGDIMHSRPVVMSYDKTSDDKTIFVSTNEGYLHAFDAKTGQEQFAFMPKELLKNIETQYTNNDPRGHVYGLDAEMTVWKHDENKDGKISGADDFVYLFFGMRRGGRNVYALDVTNINQPKLLWKIAGGMGDFTELGQTWSKPALVKIHSPDEADKGKLIDVLVFGGGYDPALDEEDVTARINDNMGKAIYIVNAKTGKLIWSDETSFKHSIPSAIRILDMDKNGSVDRLYFADTGGNVWRVDLDIDIRDGYKGATPTLYDISKATVNHFAELGGSGKDNRKFFNEPDISLVKHNGKRVLLVSIGSGYRSRPLNKEVNDQFYVLIDENVTDLPSSAFSILESDLVDVATLTGKSIIVEQEEAKLKGKNIKGWYYNLPNSGEKVLATSRTFLGKVLFTTFTSDGTLGGDPCAIPPSSARAYVLNVLTGDAVLDLNRDGDIKQSYEDKAVIAGANEILGTPQLIFKSPAASDGSKCKENDCKHYVNIRVGKKLTPIGDSSNSNDDDPISSLDLGKILPRSYWLDHNAVER